MPSRSARHHCALITRLPAGRSPMARQVIVGRSADLFGRRVDQPAVTHLHRGDGLIAGGDSADGGGRGGVTPDVDLTKRQATAAQLAAQPKAIGAPGSGVEHNLWRHAMSLRSDGPGRLRSKRLSSARILIAYGRLRSASRAAAQSLHWAGA